ncbi:hypothetical protein MLD38_015730 [Melastoma candidum]|uniref:Uncharacterized protein n=1 Tax=Melastoma candidum TaxID=119954 RepID=A0ACB9RJ03_9MYRT|nr:hypothetical protein MLD38_015730 [Melastoma candidum]
MQAEEEKKKKGPSVVPFLKLLSYADALDWILMALGGLGAIVHGMALPVGYLLLGKALNAFGNNINDTDAMVKALKRVIPYVWYMAFATFPAGILEIGCWMYASERQLARLRLSFLSSVLSQEIGAFDTELSSGKVISGITTHMSIIQDAIGEKTISQIKTVFAFVGENRAIQTFSQRMDKQSTISKGEAMIKGVGTGMFQTVTNCSWALIIWVGAVVVKAGRSTGGDVIAAIMSILFGAISLTYAAPDMQVFNQAKAAGAEVFWVIQRQSLIRKTTGRKNPDRVQGNIEIYKVHFAYPSRLDKPILQGFTLSIPAGKTVALVGSSGCGKSTIISLVARFYDPLKGQIRASLFLNLSMVSSTTAAATEAHELTTFFSLFPGTILVDDYNIQDLDMNFLRQNIGAVSQEPSLFAGTIKDNIRVGNLDANDEEIEKAAIMGNAHNFVSELPDKYLTEVGQRGFQLSGGQKQRIAIARAILKDPPILLLDEATSALDSESEKLVQDALEKAMEGRTAILIAHRMSTIVNADIIAVVENGQVKETGTHRGLLETSKFYSNLFHMQDISTVHGTSSANEAEDSESGITKGSPDKKGQKERPINVEEFQKETTVIEAQNQRLELSLFFRIWYELDRKELVRIALGSLAAAFSGISKPLFGYFIITIGVAYYEPNGKQKVGWFSIIFSVVGLLALVSHILQHYFYGVVGEKAMLNLRKSLFAGVLRNELGWFEKPENSVGLVTSRVINDTAMVKVIISDRMAVIVQCICSILIATVVSLVVNWRMALVAWAVMPCHFIGGLIQAKSAKGFSGDSAAAHHQLVTLTSEAATNIKTVASFCYEEHILGKARRSLEVPKRKSRRESVKFGIIQGISLCLWNIAHAVALWYTTILVERHQASFKNGIRAYQIFSLTVPSITELWTLIPMVITAMNILTPAFQTLDRKTEIEPDMPENENPQRIGGTVEFQNVNFIYPTRPDVVVLRNFSLRIESGSKVALVGPSGAGKSSILALVLRYYDPLGGQVLIDGRDVREYNLRMLRARIGVVQQEPLLFSSSLRENICYGNDMASEAEIEEAARQANIHEFISGLPEGYNTAVGEKGCQLSGGQKQRIAIARTLLKRPAILLLDEATSALDAESERTVIRALETATMAGEGGFLSRTTQITVAHRLSTIVKSDTIIVMDKGEIVETGPHSALIRSGGIYSRLFELQNLKD